jgi:3-hydroxy-9,10-secoandrosta-1,3,5(10)-triene-9,17-dione monooxygenase
MSQPSEEINNYKDVNRDELLDRAESLVPFLLSKSGETEKSRCLNNEVKKILQDNNLFRLMQPKRYGGLELDHLLLVDIGAILAQGCPSTSWVYSNLAIHSSMLGYFDDNAQNDVWDRCGNSLICMSVIYPAGRALKVDGGYKLSGKWPFCSGIDDSQWNIVGAIVENEDIPQEKKRLFLVPKNDYKIIDTWDSMGLTGTGSHHVVVDDKFIPNYRTLSELMTRSGDSPGSKVNTNPLFRLPMQSISSTVMAGVGLGTARGALNYFINETRNRISTYSGQNSAGLQNVQICISDSSARIDMAELILKNNVKHAIEQIYKGVLPSEGTKVRWRRDCAFAISSCCDAVNMLFTASGGSALYNSNPMSRYFRDMQAITSHIAYNTQASGAIYGSNILGLKDDNLDF